MKYQINSAISKVFPSSILPSSASLFYSKAPPQKFIPPRIRLKQRAIPHYVHLDTHKQVRSTFRKLLRAGAYRQIDPLCRLFLAQFIAESFKANKYISDSSKIHTLLAQAHDSLDILNRASYKNAAQTLSANVKDVDQVMAFCFSRMFITEGPIATRLLPTSDSLQYSFKDYPKSQNDINRHNVVRRICTLQTLPKHLVSTMDEYKAFEQNAAALALSSSSNYDKQKNQASSSSSSEASTTDLVPPLYFRFVHALKNKSVSHFLYSLTESPVSFVPLLEGTMTGAPLPPARETNLLRAQIRKVLQSIRMPLDLRVFSYLDEVLSSSNLKSNKKNKNKNKNSKTQQLEQQQVLSTSKLEELRSAVLLPQGKSKRFYLRRILTYFEKSYSCTCDKLGNIIIITPRSYRIKTSTRLVEPSSPPPPSSS